MSNVLSFPGAVALADLDRLAWQAICDWPSYSAVDVVKEGLDYGLLARYFLWDKVPRAIRYQVNPDEFALEADLLRRYQSREQQAQLSKATKLPNAFWESQIKQPLKRFMRLAGFRLDRYGRSVVFVPRQHGQLRSTIATLQTDASIRLVAPDDLGNTGIRTFQTLPKQPPNLAFAEQLFDGIVEGLKAFDVDLLAVDRQMLRQQLLQQANLVRQVEAELAAMRPQAVLVFADNHSPAQAYVAIANRQGIPTLMLQHGLDCEQYCLNDAYASVVAVWGETRKQRYEEASERSPALIQVTGNPNYDGLSLPQRLCPAGDRWLWVTRPHGPEKCLLPSRSPREGLDILAAILAALKHNKSAHLTIKPHPFDYSDLYAAAVEKAQMSDRVSIIQAPLLECLPLSDLVISEDSTAAMEAMFLGKVVIHSHFATSPPVLPLVSYAAALPARSSEELGASLKRAQTLDADAQQKMLQGQHRFIYDHAGPMDGKAEARVTALIKRAIARK